MGERIVMGRTVRLCPEGEALFDAHRRWRLNSTTRPHPYVLRYEGGRPVYLHRELAEAQPDQLVDHINGDTLDNRAENLRVCSHTQNMRNRKRRYSASSRFKGLTRKGERWSATVMVDRAAFSLGCYASEIEGAIAYDKAAQLLHGEFARLNFDPARDWLFPYAIAAASPETVITGKGLKGRPQANAERLSDRLDDLRGAQ